MNGSFLIGGVLMLGLGAGVAYKGMLGLRGGKDRLRSARARAIAEVATGGLFGVLGVAGVILAFIGKRRFPALLGTVLDVMLLGLFAAVGLAYAAGRVAAGFERRHASRAHRELGIAAPRPLWSVMAIGVMWVVALTVAFLVWGVAWAATEGGAHRAPSQHAVKLAMVVLLAVTGPLAALHMSLQFLRRKNRVRQLTQPAVRAGEAAAGRLVTELPCPPSWSSGQGNWVRRINWHRAVRAPLVRLAQAGVSPALAAPPLPAWVTCAWIVDASRWSVAIWRTDLASGDTRIKTIVVARPGNSGALMVMRAGARHPAFAGLGLLAGAIVASVAWPPALVIYVVLVGGLLSVGGLLVPVLRDQCRTAAGEQLGKRGDSALADLSASGENPDAWRRLWTALPVRPAAS